MDRQAYSKTYNQSKHRLQDAIRTFAEENPERFMELQAQALRELREPTPRPTTSRFSPKPHHFDVDEFLRQHHLQDYLISTTDRFDSVHRYFEGLNNETPKEVLTRRHPKFLERAEKITKVEPCQCPLCLALKNS